VEGKERGRERTKEKEGKGARGGILVLRLRFVSLMTDTWRVKRCIIIIIIILRGDRRPCMAVTLS